MVYKSNFEQDKIRIHYGGKDELPYWNIVYPLSKSEFNYKNGILKIHKMGFRRQCCLNLLKRTIDEKHIPKCIYSN